MTRSSSIHVCQAPLVTSLEAVTNQASWPIGSMGCTSSIYSSREALIMQSAITSLVGFLMALGCFSQCQYDVCGYWYSEDYNAGVPVEYFSIDIVDGLMICTKVLGDPFVPTGHITWQGVPSTCAFPGQIYATSGIGNPIVPLNCQITILSSDHIRVSFPFVLNYYRSTTAHLESIGVDYSTFPVSCIDCPAPVPTVFTPNGDGINDILELLCGARSTRFAITNRWG